jgi:sugar phosphate isomerase/epimerase
MLRSCAGAVPALAYLSSVGGRAAEPERVSLGIVSYSYSSHRFVDPLAFLEFCYARGAGGVQIAVGVRTDTFAREIRRQLESKRMYLEGSIRLPKDRADVERFESEVRSAKGCGATLLRTVMLNGRRYEAFPAAEDFRRFAERSRQSMELAKPVIERHGVRLAIENHKDWRIDELVDILRRAGSPQIGVCVDTGNSIALLEDPMEVVEAYAPWALTTHLKDMGVEEYADGFLLAELPLGSGFLDLPKIVEILRRARPEIHFNLEMITRDPLKIPCLTKNYWATLGNLPGRQLADTLRLVRTHATKKPLARISGLSREEKLQKEDENVRLSLSYARERLGL